MLTFGAEDQVLLCAFHGGKHGWTNLAWLADLSALMETHVADWPRLLAEARRKRLLRSLLTGVCLVHDLFGAPVPAEVARSLDRDRTARKLAAEARLSLLRLPQSRKILPKEVRYELGLTEGWAGKTAYCWRRITEPNTEDWELARGARPFRLMRKYAVRLAGLQ